MSQSESYPDVAFVLSLIGGIFVVLIGLIVMLVGAALTFMVGGLGGIFGLLGVIWGAVIIYSAVQIKLNPSQHSTWGVLIIVFSLVSWIGAFGGLIIGFLLALIGGILALAWNQTTTNAPTAYSPQPSTSQPTVARSYPQSGQSEALDKKYCPYRGKQLS